MIADGGGGDGGCVVDATAGATAGARVCGDEHIPCIIWLSHDQLLGFKLVLVSGLLVVVHQQSALLNVLRLDYCTGCGMEWNGIFFVFFRALAVFCSQNLTFEALQEVK